MKGKFLISLVAILAIFALSNEHGQCMEDVIKPLKTVRDNNDDLYLDYLNEIPKNLWVEACNTARSIRGTSGAEYQAYMTVNTLYHMLTGYHIVNGGNPNDGNVFENVKHLMLEYWPALLQKEDIEMQLNLQDGFDIVGLVKKRYGDYGSVDEIKQRTTTVTQLEILKKGAQKALDNVLRKTVKNYTDVSKDATSHQIYKFCYGKFVNKYIANKYDNNDYETRRKKIKDCITEVQKAFAPPKINHKQKKKAK